MVQGDIRVTSVRPEAMGLQHFLVVYEHQRRMHALPIALVAGVYREC